MYLVVAVVIEHVAQHLNLELSFWAPNASFNLRKGNTTIFFHNRNLLLSFSQFLRLISSSRLACFAFLFYTEGSRLRTTVRPVGSQVRSVGPLVRSVALPDPFPERCHYFCTETGVIPTNSFLLEYCESFRILCCREQHAALPANIDYRATIVWIGPAR
jgi:hypothetical protein